MSFRAAKMGTLSKNGKPERRFPFGKLFKLICKVLLMVVCFAVYLPVIPVFFVLTIPMYLYRVLVSSAQQILKPDWVGIMNSRDALVGMDETANSCECMITLLMTIKGNSNMQLIRDTFQKQVLERRNSKGELCYEKMTHYYENWLGFTFWKREQNFHIDTHVKELKLTDDNDKDNNGDNMVTEEQLMKVLGSAATKPFPRGVSPWEVIVVKNYKKSSPKIHTNLKSTKPVLNLDKNSAPDAEFALALRVHHAIGDGYSIMKMLWETVSKDSDGVLPFAPVRSVSPLVKLFQNAVILFLTPYYHFLQFFLLIDKSVWHLPSSKLKKEWLFSMSERISFADIKAVSVEHGVCTTATLLAGLAGGVHNYMKDSGNGNKNRDMMRGLSPMPWKDHPMDTLVNHWTVGVFDIPAHMESAHERLRITNKTVNSLKKSPILVTNFITVPMLLSGPKFLTDFWGTNWMTSMIISNFPAPNTACSAFNRQYYVDEYITWVPHMRGSAGLGVMFLSYNGGVRVSVSIDKALIGDEQEVAKLTQCISQEFKNLKCLRVASETIV